MYRSLIGTNISMWAGSQLPTICVAISISSQFLIRRPSEISVTSSLSRLDIIFYQHLTRLSGCLSLSVWKNPGFDFLLNLLHLGRSWMGISCNSTIGTPYTPYVCVPYAFFSCNDTSCPDNTTHPLQHVHLRGIQ